MPKRPRKLKPKVKRYSTEEITAARLLVRAINFAQIPEDEPRSVEWIFKSARQAWRPSFTPDQLKNHRPKVRLWQHKYAAQADRLFKDMLAADFHGIGLQVDETYCPKPAPDREYQPEVKLSIWKQSLLDTFNEAVDQTMPEELSSFLFGPIDAAAHISPSHPMLTLIGDVNSLIQLQVVTLIRFVGVDRLRRCRCSRIFLYHRHGGSREYCSPKCQKHFYRKDHPPQRSPRKETGKWKAVRRKQGLRNEGLKPG